MQSLLKRRSRSNSLGQGVTEFALIAPILLISLLITIDFGRMFFSYITLNNVTRLAANYGATNPGAITGGSTGNYDALVAHESAGLNCALLDDGPGNNPPIPTFPAGTGLSGTSVATMSCDFSLLTPFVTQFFGGPLTMTARSEFPIRTGAIQNVSGNPVIPVPGAPVAGFDFAGVSGGTINGSGNVNGTGPVSVNVVDTSQNADTYVWDWGDGTLRRRIRHRDAATPLVFNPGTYSVNRPSRTRWAVPAGRERSQLARPPHRIRRPVSMALRLVSGYMTGGGAGGTAITGTYGLTVNFTNTVRQRNRTYAWTFGDGGSSDGREPAASVQLAREYSAWSSISRRRPGRPGEYSNGLRDRRVRGA